MNLSLSPSPGSTRPPTLSLPLHVAADHPVFAGHFPGAPLVPGALLVALVMEMALADVGMSSLLGPAPRLSTAKFLAPLRPGDAATLHLVADPRGLRFELVCGERIVASGQFEAAQPQAVG